MTSCPTDDVVTQFIEGMLDTEARRQFCEHASGCAACSELLARVFEGGPASSRKTGEAPKAVARYILVRAIGAGGMGVVYEAHDPELNRSIAVKLLRPAQSTSKRAAQLHREAQAMARLSHPNVVVVHDVGTVNGQVFLAMELVHGSNARAWLAERARAWPEVLDLFIAAGRGLAAAHDAGIIHRDFKPDNVLVGYDGRVRVTDFGLAASARGEIRADQGAGDDAVARSLPLMSSMTGLGGTPAYMAPEQFGGGHADVRSDIFSFCLALYEGLYGELPFDGSATIRLPADVRSGGLRPAPRDSRVPQQLRKVLLVGLSTEPSSRWPSMTALLAALERAARSSSTERRRLLIAGSIVALAVTTGAAFGVAVVVRRSESEPRGAGSSAAASTPSPRRSSLRITTRANVVSDGYAVLPDSSLVGVEHTHNRVFRVGRDGAVSPLATDVPLDRPVNVARGPDGSLYVAEWGTHVIRRISEGGKVTPFAGVRGGGFGGDGGPALSARFDAPTHLFVARDGSLLIADVQNRRIRRVRKDGVVETIAGNGRAGTGGDGGPAVEAQLGEPESIIEGRDGTLYVEDKQNGRIRSIDASGIIRTVASGLDAPSSIAVRADGTLYVSETANHRILAIAPGGASPPGAARTTTENRAVTVLAGTGEPGFSGDGGPAFAARLMYPGPIRLSPDERTLFVSDVGNARIREIALEANGGDAEVAAGAACDPAKPFGAAEALSAIDSSANELSASVSGDGLTLAVASDRAGGAGGADLYLAHRGDAREPFGDLVLLDHLNSSYDELHATLSRDATTLVFESSAPPTRDGRAGLWWASRAKGAALFGDTRLALVFGAKSERTPFLAGDGDALLFAADPAGHFDLYRVAVGPKGPVGEPLPIAEVSTDEDETHPVESRDQLTLYFARGRGGAGSRVWVARRASRAEAYGRPARVEELEPAHADAPTWLSPDGCVLWFVSARGGGPGARDVFRVTRGK
jgi:serine/threonine protein kinase/sugar lactone lactonase YvrE